MVAQLGADSMISDPLTDLMLTNNSYTQVVQELKGSWDKILATGALMSVRRVSTWRSCGLV